MLNISIPGRLLIALLFTSAILVESCNDGVLHAPAPAAASVHVTASMSRVGGGARDAFDRADRLFVRFRAGDVVRLEQEMGFNPSATETVVRVQVPLRELAETMTAELELRLGERPLFRGVASGTLSVGAPTPMDVQLDPVVAAVTCGTGLVQLSAYGRTAQLMGNALFASGDPILPSDVAVIWSTATNGAVSVSGTGLATALRDGDAAVTCSASGVSATLQVRVFAVADSAQVAPASATIVTGTSVPLVVTLFDSLGNSIPTLRPVVWSSRNSGVATVSPTGVATGVMVGSTWIIVASGPVLDSSSLVVLIPSTAVTIASTQITGTGATLLGSVNPRGVATQASFDYGTDPALGAPTATPIQNVGTGSVDVSLSRAITGLVPSTTYYFRTVASSTGGVVRGATLSFRTPTPPSVVTIGLDAAKLYTVRGSVTPSGSATVAWFEYGTSPLLGTSAQTAKQPIGSGPSAMTVTQALSGLQPSTTYYVRVVASNDGGTTSGSIVSFKTFSLPTLVSTSGYIWCSSQNTLTICFAKLSGSANPNGAPTQAWFEYSIGDSSLTRSFSSTVARALGNGSSPASFAADSVRATGAFYFRAVVSNVAGTVRGNVKRALVAVE
ncbi:MAG: Ig-like domain-containing protein [Gemmatimonadaceae bacterium]